MLELTVIASATATWIRKPSAVCFAGRSIDHEGSALPCKLSEVVIDGVVEEGFRHRVPRQLVDGLHGEKQANCGELRFYHAT